MSLELAAQHLASRGRKGDSMLVHMAPEEVSGLQALARAGGGTLTLNPDTGLPEANFLKRMLPMLIGAGLAAATGGTSLALTPGMIGLGLGGLETLRTGSLEKGVMAGLGAYGGAGLTGGLAAAGAASPTATAQALGTPAATGAGSQAAMLASQNAGFGQAGVNALAGSAGTAVGAVPVAANVFSAGANALGTEAGRSTALSAMGGGAQAAKFGLAALSPTLQPDTATPFDGGGPNPFEFEFDPNNQTYTRVPVGTRQRDILAPTTRMAADGGMMNSGPLEALSAQNEYETLMANGGQMFAAGGQVNLQGTFTAADQGGGGQFGQANANGYPAAGSGAPLQGFSSSFGQMGGGQMGSGQMGGRQMNNGLAAPTQIGAPLDDVKEAQRAAQERQQKLQQFAQLPLEKQQAIQQQQQRAQGQAEQLQQRLGQGDFSLAHVMPQQRNAFSETMGNAPLGAFSGARMGFDFSKFAAGGMASLAQGGPSHLGDYSDGGRLLKGPGDGVSDSIPATIADKRPARLADGEFVVPARIVSELGNGSTEAGARKLYAMMDRVQKARGKTTGKNRVAVNSRAEKLLPA